MPDVNVLVYAHRADLDQHAASAAWVQTTVVGAQPFALSELVVAGFVRVVTNRRVFHGASTVEEALAFVEELTKRPTCRLVRPGPRHLAIFSELCRAYGCSGGLVADAYHAALAIEHGCTWVTYDTDFARFKELDWRLP